MARNDVLIRSISEVVSEQLAEHQKTGGHYYDERSGVIAATAINAIMPELVTLQKERVKVEMSAGFLIEGGAVHTLDRAFTEGVLARISIQQIVRLDDSLGTDTPLAFDDFDLFAVVEPRYANTDPSDIVFGDELLVPFREVQLFEATD